jgi:hypothetical protein
MPDTIDQLAPGGVIQLANSPAALDDATFDSLFPADGGQSTQRSAQQTQQAQGTQAVQQTQQTQQQQTVVQQQSDAPFLKGDSSVYKTAEAAIEGLNQKDALIKTLRTRYALTTGVDPVTGQPVGQAQQQASNDYSTNPSQYLDDLYKASKSGAPEAYSAVQAKFVMDTLKPLAPVMQQAAKQQALETVAKDNVEIPKFVASPVYQRTLDANPDLSDAIRTAESDYRFHSRLPGLYKLAHMAGQGLQLPELLKASQQTQTSQTQTQSTQQQQVRTTAQPTTLSPGQQGKAPSFRTHEGIKAVIADMEARGAKLEF